MGRSRRATQGPELRVLGVMTGTSCDAIDAACLSVSPRGWKPLWEETQPYPRELRERVLALQRPKTRVALRDLLELHRDLGEWYGAALHSTLGRAQKNGFGMPHAIANHGQTVAHHPARARSKRPDGMTLQLGDPTRIARATGLTVVSSFRDGDLAAGGQGAPLVPLFHFLIAKALDEGGSGVSIHNLGGISNLTYVGPNDELLAFDTGPGNAWIDAAVERVTSGKLKFDRGGRLGGSALPHVPSVKALLRHPYFQQPPPKSTGRDDFPTELFLKVCQGVRGPALVATASALTIESIARAYERWILEQELPLRRIYLCGGGARNPLIVEGLQARLPGREVLTLEQAGFDPVFIEAQAFAFFGFLALTGTPIGGSWTGVRGFGPPAHLVPGENWNEVLDVIARMRSRA